MRCSNTLCGTCCQAFQNPLISRQDCEHHGVVICRECFNRAEDNCPNVSCVDHCNPYPCEPHQTNCEGIDCGNYRASKCTNRRCACCCAQTQSYSASQCSFHRTTPSPPRTRPHSAPTPRRLTPAMMASSSLPQISASSDLMPQEISLVDRFIEQQYETTKPASRSQQTQAYIMSYQTIEAICQRVKIPP